MKLFSIEGNRQHLDGGAMFGNAPKALWERWAKPDANNRIPLATRALLLQTADGRHILFEAGVGAFFEPKLRERYGIEPAEHLLLENLKAAGVQEEDIDIVILSHLHFDHAGGLLSAFGEGEPRLHFPNAKYYVGKEHWERAQAPHSREKASFVPLLNQLLKDSGRLHFVEGSSHPELDFGVSFHYVHGHTVGLMISILECPDGPLAFVSDLIPGKAWMHLPIAMGYDRFAELLVDEKKTFLKMIAEKGGSLFFTHDPEIDFVRVIDDVKGGYAGVKNFPL